MASANSNAPAGGGGGGGAVAGSSSSNNVGPPPNHHNYDIMICSMHTRRLNQPGSPESEFNNFECFQNYTAPEVFVQGLAGIVNQGDVEVMIRAQKQMLQRFEKTNEMLLNCNALSASRLKLAGEEFKKHSKLLGEMKKDLDYIFKKIRNIKAKISTQYPDAFAAAQPTSRQSYAEEAEDDELVACAAVASAAATTESDAKTMTTTTAATVAVAAAMPETVCAVTVTAPTAKSHSNNSSSSKAKLEKRKSGSKVSIDYVQIAEQSPIEGGLKTVGVEVEGALQIRRSIGGGSSTENSIDSSDGTSDTN